MSIHDNLIQFRRDPMMLLWSCVLILAGNTAYPIIFRWFINLLSKTHPENRALKYLLANPRRCYTHMFPSIHTRILLSTVFFFTISEFVVFLALDYDLEVLKKDLSGPHRVLLGFFQAVSTRNAGFAAVDLSQLTPPMNLVYSLLMYVSTYPVISAIRRSTESDETFQRTNSSTALDTPLPPHRTAVQRDEQTIIRRTRAGVLYKAETVTQSNELTLEVEETAPKATTWAQAKMFLLKDSILLFLALFAICCAEQGPIRNTPYVDIFSILFEVSSAYGNVGLSLGIPGKVISQSGDFTPFSKIVIVLVMLAGRHRAIPRSIDEAVYIQRFPGSPKSSFPSSPRKVQEVLTNINNAVRSPFTATFQQRSKLQDIPELDLGNTSQVNNSWDQADHPHRFELHRNTKQQGVKESIEMSTLKKEMGDDSGDEIQISRGPANSMTPKTPSTQTASPQNPRDSEFTPKVTKHRSQESITTTSPGMAPRIGQVSSTSNLRNLGLSAAIVARELATPLRNSNAPNTPPVLVASDAPGGRRNSLPVSQSDPITNDRLSAPAEISTVPSITVHIGSPVRSRVFSEGHGLLGNADPITPASTPPDTP